MVPQSQSLCKQDSPASHTKTDQNAAGTEKRCHGDELFEDIFHLLVVIFFLLNSDGKKELESVLRSEKAEIPLQCTLQYRTIASFPWKLHKYYM